MAYQVMFHENRIALSQEIQHHPQLVKLLQNHKQDEFEVMLAEIALYCEVVLDATYSQEDIDRLCGILRDKLYKKRSPIILLN